MFLEGISATSVPPTRTLWPSLDHFIFPNSWHILWYFFVIPWFLASVFFTKYLFSCLLDGSLFYGLFHAVFMLSSPSSPSFSSSLVCFMFYHPHTPTLSKACLAWELVERTGLQGLDVTSAIKCQLCHSLTLLTEKHGLFSRLNYFHIGKWQIMPISFDSLGPYKE